MGGRAPRAAITRTPRPRDRKAQIVSAAAHLFYRYGYHNVGTTQIAQTVGITAGALYRHFGSKKDLLVHALIDSFEQARIAVERSPGDLAAMVEGVVEAAVDRRDLGVLWNRELRHLDGERRALVRERFFAFLNYFAGELHATRPELSRSDAKLLSWAVLAVLTSPSYHAGELDRTTLRALLYRLAVAVSTSPLESIADHVTTETEPPGAGLALGGRRESILAAAAHLFHRRGYQTVTMDDVGAAVGITSAAVYKHFDAKSDLLAAAIARAAEPLALGLNRAVATATTPAGGLDNALAAYVDFAIVHYDLVGILVCEVMNLPDGQRHEVRRAQHDYVAEWVRLLAGARPDLDQRVAQFVVHAVLNVVNDVTRTRQLRRRPDLGRELRLIGDRLFAVEV